MVDHNRDHRIFNLGDFVDKIVREDLIANDGSLREYKLLLCLIKGKASVRRRRRMVNERDLKVSTRILIQQNHSKNTRGIMALYPM